MIATTTPAAASRPRTTRPRAFTLLELGVVASVTLVLMAIGAFAYSSVMNDQGANAGKTMLGAAQVEGRRIAATNGYQFPADLAARLEKRSAVTAKAATARFEFVPGPSYMTGTPNNPGNTHRVSVATDGLNVVAYAVQTAGTGAAGNCWVMIEDLSDTAGKTTRWGKAASVAPGTCAAAQAAACPRMVNGTSDNPTALATLRNCPAP